MSPRVTVLMSVYNGAAYLREAVDSILAQTFTDFELLVIDDASTDESAAILASYDDPRVRIVTNETNAGLTRSLNRGLELARGEYVARHDADDRSRPARLAEQVRFLDENRDVAAAGTQVVVIDGNGRRRPSLDATHPQSAAAIRFSLMFTTPMVHGAVMFRRSIVWDELRGYDESFRTSQDVELWSRLAARAPMRNLDATLLEYRVHSQSVAATRYTRENVTRVESVLHRNVLMATGDEALASEWPPLWNGIVNTNVVAEPENPGRAVKLVDAMRDLFFEREPAARHDRGIAATYGGVQLQIAQFLARRDRGAAMRATLRAATSAPAALFRRGALALRNVTR